MTVEKLCFEIMSYPPSVTGRESYVIEDHAFDFEMDMFQVEQRVGVQQSTSFVVDTLQLEVAVDSSLCLYIWGYSPMGRWEQSSLSPPLAQRGSLRAIHDEPLVPGVSIGLEKMLQTNAWFDTDSGWFCLGNKDTALGAEAVEFATCCLAVVVGGRLSSLWIKPENWKDVTEAFLKQRQSAFALGDPVLPP